MKYNRYLAIIMAGSLAACGGGGSGSSATAPVSNAEISSSITVSASSVAVLKTTVAQGMVTGFGSVIVNGVHYDVNNAAINVDGEAKVESDLGVGQILRITGTIDADGLHGKASKVDGESQLRGPIDSIDLSAGIIVALGQSIIINADTFYQDGLSADTLKVGDVIKVSSYTNAEGALVATRIDVKTGTAASTLQLAGEIADLDTTALTFTINGKTVDYSKATLANDITLADGVLVRVRGNLVGDIFVASGNLQTSPLNIKHDHDIDTHVGVVLAGLVKNVVANTSFSINDVTVIITADTDYQGGTASELVDGLLVKIQGSVDADNNLVAEKIKLIQQPQVNDNGLVQTVDLVANTFSVNDVTFSVTVDTSFNDSGKEKVRLFSLKDLVVGNTVNVRGYKVAATDSTPEHMVATRVQRHNAPAVGAGNFKVDVHGVVESVTGSTLKIAGHTVTVNDTTKIDGFDTLDAFLAGALGAKLIVKGSIENNVFVAATIKVLDENANPDPRHSHSSRSAQSSSDSSVPAGGFPSHPDSSHSDSSHSDSSRGAPTPRSESNRSESSKPAPVNPGSEHSRSSKAWPENPDSASSRSTTSRANHSDSSRAAPANPRSDSSHSQTSKPAPVTPSSRAPRPASSASSSSASAV